MTVATTQAPAQETTRRYTASNKQTPLWRRQSLRAACEKQVAYTARELHEFGSLHLFAVPAQNRLTFRFVTWNCQDNEFYCDEHRMHACEHSGAAMQALMQRGLLPYMDSAEPEEVEANARIWRAAAGQ